MTLLEEVLRRIHSDLKAAKVEFAIIGGLAVSIRTEPRFTRDADLAVAVSDDREAESLIFSLQSHGYAVQSTVEQEATSRLATVRLLPPGQRPSGVVVDLLFASSGIESDIVAAAEPLELLPGLTMPVARPGHLIALKVLSRDDRARPQDLIDLRALLQQAPPPEIELTRQSLKVISSRGYHRNRDLESDFKEILKELSSPDSA